METERLTIDPIRESDKEDYFQHISHDRKVLKTFICRYAENLESFDFSSYPNNPALYAIRLKETEKLIGILVLCSETETTCEIGYGIGSQYWNQGYATEAVRRFIQYCFDEKGFQKIYASFFTGNDASRHVMEKCGMTYSHFSEKELTYLDEERDLTYYAISRNKPKRLKNQRNYTYISLREYPELLDRAATWFHEKWGVPKEAYYSCMKSYLSGETEYGWYLCLDGDRIAGGLGVIENDFHDRKDLAPNVCAVYTEEACRGQGIAGRLLNLAVDDMRAKGIQPLYLVTDHTGFYERYGWEFFCMAQGDDEAEMTRVYIHR